MSTPIPPAVNYFVMRECNMRCRFCYATFRDVNGRLSNQDAERLVRLLAEGGFEKITFVGGEPTLHPHIEMLIRTAHDAGLTTQIVSNGTRLLLPLLDACKDSIDWVGLDIDSIHEDVEVAIGRTAVGRNREGHVARTIALAEEIHKRGIRLKLNTVVTRLSWQEDMSSVIEQIKPDRWKGFQVLPVKGQNDGSVEDLLITPEQFKAWADRHLHLGLIPEDNDLMSLSYALVDPMGRFYASDGAGHQYGKSILEAGVQAAWDSVPTPFRHDRFDARGGRYNWRTK